MPQGHDRPAVFTRIFILVDARHAELAAIGVVKRVVFVTIDVVTEIGILADIERAIGTRQKAGRYRSMSRAAARYFGSFQNA